MRQTTGTETVRICITGRVQGVGYRLWATRTATGLGLRGWVRNRADGSVEALVTGEAQDVAAMVQAAQRGPPAAQMIAGLKQMAVRAHSRGIKIIGATLTPFGNETYMANAWNPQREEVRTTVNDWVRDGGAFDAVADFDKALRDPERSTQMLTKYDCGDGLHPSDLGHNKMGDAIDLALFE